MAPLGCSAASLSRVAQACVCVYVRAACAVGSRQDRGRMKEEERDGQQGKREAKAVMQEEVAHSRSVGILTMVVVVVV